MKKILYLSILTIIIELGYFITVDKLQFFFGLGNTVLWFWVIYMMITKTPKMEPNKLSSDIFAGLKLVLSIFCTYFLIDFICKIANQHIEVSVKIFCSLLAVYVLCYIGPIIQLITPDKKSNESEDS